MSAEDPRRELLGAISTEVAPLLLGARLTHATAEGRVTVRLTELEAYVGDGVDPGSHAYRGRTRRNASMYGPPGHLYTYFTYGMHTCANVVTSPDGIASAVLLRAGEVVEGHELARERRRALSPDAELARGPARLCVALGIALTDDGSDLLPEGGEAGGTFLLELPERPVPASSISSGPRTGVSGAGGTERFPWRFWIAGDPTVSRYRAHVPRKRR